MTRRTVLLSAATMVLAGGLCGCNTRPPTPKTGWANPKVKVLDVDPADTEEVADVRAFESAKMRYESALTALENYYQKTGDMTRVGWAQKEMENLQLAQEFTFNGAGPVEAPASTLPANASERDLVEAVLKARKGYRHSADRLAQLYEKRNADFKAYVIHTMQARFRPEETYRYYMTVELPPEHLRPGKIIPKADILFVEAETLHKDSEAKPALPNYDDQRRALAMFRDLIDRYPNSTKIALSAYYIGYIYGKYFDEPYLAVRFYDRALQYDFGVPKPVRYQMAVEYDFGLGDRPNAVKWYRAAIKDEPYFKENVETAKKRIEYITSLPPYRSLATPTD